MLNQLKPSKGSASSRRRVGRGPGSGLGKTAGKGHKGQKARSGGKAPRGYEGGQMPLSRRLPKRGFSNPFRKEYSVVNLRDLDRVQDVDVIDPDLLLKLRMVSKNQPVKILAIGDLSRPITIRAHKFSAAAAAKVEKAGGKAEVI